MNASAPVTLARGDGSRIVDPRRTLVRDEAEWRALWAAHAGPDVPPPAVDFGSEMVAAVFAGELPSAGFDIAIVGIRRNHSLTVAVEERRPEPGVAAAQIVVTPFHIVRIPRYDGPVVFENAGTTRARSGSAAAAASPPDFSPHVPSSTGLDASLAAALAYLAGPFSGIVILLAESTSGFVRFHAWQSIVGLGGLGLLAVGLLFLAFVGLLVSPLAFSLLYWLAGMTALTWVVAWAFCLVKAFNGSMWKMPVAGDRAEELASGAALW